MNYANLIQNITENIKTNGSQAITAQVLQDVLVDMVGELGQSGALLGGVIDTSFVPDPTNDAQVVYIAESPGTYTNFNGLVVGAGEVAFFYFDGNTWAKSSVDVLEVVNNLNSTATDKALSAAMGKQLQDSLTQAINDLNTAIGGKADTSYVNTQLATKADKTYVDNQLATKADSSQVAADLADKIDKVHDAEVGNVPIFKADGGIEDSGLDADNVAEQDGYYETMVVGAAENLIGRGSVPANYTRRRSGGGSIGSGAAVLEEIQGNTLVWNQAIGETATSTVSAYGYITTRTGVNVSIYNDSMSTPVTGNYAVFPGAYKKIIVGHKYYLKSDWISKYPSLATNVVLYFSDGDNLKYFDTIYDCTSACTSIYFRVRTAIPLSALPVGGTLSCYVNIIDLTLMFGAGNEPSTVAEFDALFPLTYYNYDAGTAKHFTGTGILNDGFQQWDEDWEVGTISASTGENETNLGRIRSKNYIPIFPITQYYMIWGSSASSGRVVYYDANKNYISGTTSFIPRTIFTTPSNARYLRFSPSSGYGAAYLNDICLNFSDTARNGEYEPYWSETHTLPITTATSGGVAIFPNGEKSAGTAHDRYYKSVGSEHFDKGQVVIGKIKVSDITDWTITGTGDFRSWALNNIVPADSVIYNIVCDKYTRDTAANVYNRASNKIFFCGKSGYFDLTTTQLVICDTDYSTVAAFVAAMGDTEFYFELATPTDYTLDTPFSAQYRVDGMGTETVLPENTATPTTSPIICEVKYPMNAVDTLRNLPQNYISKASMDAILTAFKTAGVITNYTLTWDATNQKYNCTITA